jgi:RNA polymerase sigma-70 factor, ECF subfamily
MTNENTAKQKTFMTLLEPVYGRLTRYIRAMTPDREEARDILGETLLAAYESFDSVQNENSFVFYLFAVSRRIHWKWRRKKQFFIPIGAHHENLEFAGMSPETHADVGKLRSVLQKLPYKQREALVLFELSGLSIEEICRIQGGTLSGVKARLARGRKRLASMMNESDKPQEQLVYDMDLVEKQESEA